MPHDIAGPCSPRVQFVHAIEMFMCIVMYGLFTKSQVLMLLKLVHDVVKFCLAMKAIYFHSKYTSRYDL